MLYRFGSCRLDVERRQLLRDGVDRPLPPKAFSLLRVLIDARPRVLTKAEVMDLVWPDTYVAEANVAILIGDIRTAIGDSAREPQFIKTHFGVGYSFCGEVTELARRPTVPLAGPVYVLTIGERRILLVPGAMTVGRDPTCDIVLPDPSVSRSHAKFHLDGGVVELEDLESKNGTRVGRQRIHERVRLTEPVELIFGSVQTQLLVERSGDGSTVTLVEA